MATEQQIESSLKELNELKAALDEHAIVAITDPRGKISCVNGKFCSISKYSRGKLPGQDHRIIDSGFHPEEFVRDLWNTTDGVIIGETLEGIITGWHPGAGPGRDATFYFTIESENYDGQRY